MKKILSVVGARPNFMKVAPIHRAFQRYSPEIEHSIVHTGQHYDTKMSDTFFQDLDMPEPAVFLGIGSGSHAVQTAKVMVEFEKVCESMRPDIVIVVGDVNSTVGCSLVSVKMGIPTAHVEAGLRSFDRAMPEEINRIATDAICDYWFVTEQSGIDELRKQGAPENNIFFVGNTMIDSLHYALPKAKKLQFINELGLTEKNYALITMHRPSNVDEPEQLRTLLVMLAELTQQRDIIFPVHPRTRKNIEIFGLSDIIDSHPRMHLIDPQGYITFLHLMMNADFVMTDSGGVQEETTALGVPCLTIRTTTERPITTTLGTNILVQPNPDNIRQALYTMVSQPRKSGQIPPLWDGKAAERIAEIIHNLI
ncbi:MAG TPA: UDP-N-acetylglucosamine 2-epimerase (non-hydrolyzing) [Candidatus Kapabacteria bacterium]|nr:UDP-N-acetylglucosamine 2-epimerase (non-hydrolyzing) [Candidatus Kapabacteria bacterium]